MRPLAVVDPEPGLSEGPQLRDGFKKVRVQHLGAIAPIETLDVRVLIPLSRLVVVWPRRAGLLFTSPPYYGLTNYHYGQWLRLWLLEEAPNARRKPGRHRARFENREKYERLLRTVFSRAAGLCTRTAVAYVRTGRQKVTYEITRRVLRETFPRRR